MGPACTHRLVGGGGRKGVQQGSNGACLHFSLIESFLSSLCPEARQFISSLHNLIAGTPPSSGSISSAKISS